MYIENISVESFGNLKNVSVDFDDGVNIIRGKNESGKSTIAAFVKFALYGFSDKTEKLRGVSLADGVAGGSLTLSCGGERYRIERRFSAGREECSVIELSGNTRVMKGKVPGRELLGIPEEVFENTSFVNQLGGSRVNGKSIGEAVDNIMFSADESVNIPKAKKKLDDARAELLHKNQKGGKIYNLRETRDTLRAELSKMSEENRELIALKGTIREYGEKLSANEEKLKGLGLLLDGYAEQVRRRREKNIADIKEALDKKPAELEAVTRKYGYEGFFPTREYIDELKATRGELDFARRGAAELKNTIKTIRDDEERRERIAAQKAAAVPSVSSLVESYGGREALSSRLSNLAARSRRFKIFAAASGFFAILPCAVLSAIFMKMAAPAPGVCFAVLFAVLLALCIAFIVMSVKASTERESILGAFGASGERELWDIITLSEAEDGRKVASAAEPLEKELEKKAEQISELESQLAMLAAKYGGGDVSEVVSRASAAIKAHDTVREQTENLRIAYESAVKQNEELSSEAPRELPADFRLPEDFNPQATKREYDFIVKANRSLLESIHEKELRSSRLEATVRSPSDISDRISALDEDIERLTARHDAYVYAIEKLGEAGAGLRDGIAPKLSRYAGEMMRSLTGGKYEKLDVSRDLDMSFAPGASEGEMSRGVEYMSAGTLDLAYISLRIALLSLLGGNEGEMPPLIFDESFSSLDDGRLKNMMSLIHTASESGTQVIVMTCVDREHIAMGGLPHKVIKMEDLTSRRN